jgi:carbon starvation protein
MLLEAFVALIALSTILILAPAEVRGSPARIYGDGIGRYLTVVLGPERLVFATTFGAMAFSTFVFDTLDVATRLGRYLLQELFGARGRVAAFVATLATLVPPFVILATAPPTAPGQRPAYMDYWLLFSTSNQLLAASPSWVTVWSPFTSDLVYAVADGVRARLTLWTLESRSRLRCGDRANGRFRSGHRQRIAGVHRTGTDW